MRFAKVLIDIALCLTGGGSLILKCAQCGNSIDLILLDTPVKTGRPGNWKVSFVFYRGVACECALTIRNPEKTDEVKNAALKNPEKYRNTMDQIMSNFKEPKPVKKK